MMAPAATAVMAHGHVDQETEPVLLIVAQRLIKRLGRIGELSDFGRALGHGVSPRPKTSDGIFPLLVLGALAPRGHALLPRLGHIANGLLDRGPILFLVRCELQAGFQTRDARIRERLQIFRAWPPVFVLCRALRRGVSSAKLNEGLNSASAVSPATMIFFIKILRLCVHSR